MLRRTTGILATAAAITIAAIAPARADAPTLKSYQASASASALELSLLGQNLAVSQTQAELNSSPSAAANGAALLLAGTPVPEGALVKAPEGPNAKNVCALNVDLAALTSGAVSLANAALACATTNAKLTGGAPSADSTTGEIVINILAPGGTALAPLLTPLFANVSTITTPVITALSPIFTVVQSTTQIELNTVLNSLLANLATQTVVLAQIAVAPSASVVKANSVDGVVAQAGSNGVSIRILPGVSATLQALGLNVAPVTTPLLTVELGRASALVTRNATTGAPSPDASAAQLLSITAADELGIIKGVTGQLTAGINALAVAQLSCNGGVLADIVCIDLGSVNELDSAELDARKLNFGPGTVGREASAANVQVLPIAASALGGSVLGVTLARATAAANALPVDPACCTPSPPLSRGSDPLPRTGGEAAMGLTLALLAVGAAGVALVRRSRTV
jgi:hypothetical protein